MGYAYLTRFAPTVPPNERWRECQLSETIFSDRVCALFFVEVLLATAATGNLGSSRNV